jgi:hypothetical protein
MNSAAWLLNAIGPKTVSNVQKVGKFNWKNATVEKQ